MICHAMTSYTNSVHHLNPQQVSIIADDQPLYAPEVG